jgi:hypothetical protein
MQSLRERTTLAEKRGGYVHRANTCEDEPACEPVSHTGRPLDTLDCRRLANVFAHLNRCLRSHFFGSQCIKSQGGVAGCRASVGRSHEQSLLLRASCFHL